MANSLYGGNYYPATSSPVQVPQDFLALVSSLEGRTVPSFVDSTTRNAAGTTLTTAQRRGALCHVAGYGWTGWDGAAWVDFDNNKIKKGRVDAIVESNGNARIQSADCFFNGVAPSVVLCFSVMGPQYTFAWSLNDGGGALIRGYDNGTNAFVAAGAAVAFYFLAVK